jgi:hypothetical protein
MYKINAVIVKLSTFSKELGKIIFKFVYKSTALFREFLKKSKKEKAST